MELKTVKIEKPDDTNFVLGQTHFINITAQLILQLLQVYFPPVFRRDFHDCRSVA